MRQRQNVRQVSHHRHKISYFGQFSPTNAETESYLSKFGTELHTSTFCKLAKISFVEKSFFIIEIRNAFNYFWDAIPKQMSKNIFV
jgi:hypothetical protein